MTKVVAAGAAIQKERKKGRKKITYIKKFFVQSSSSASFACFAVSSEMEKNK